MADTGISSTPPPMAWSDAFTALPLEAPPAGGWTSVAARLPVNTSARRASAQRRRLFAVAATFAVLLPLGAVWLQRDEPTAPGAPARIAATDRTGSIPPVASMPNAPASQPVASDPTRGPEIASTARPARRVAAAPRMPRSRSASGGTPVARHASVPTRAVPRSHGSAVADVAQVPEDATVLSRAPSAASTGELEQLLLESARLEALVGAVRDERVMSAPAAVLASSVDDRIGLIDAALGQASDDMARTALWRQRVDALQELASIEGTQRWLAAHGEPLGALARVD